MIAQSTKLVVQQVADLWIQSGVVMGQVTHQHCWSAVAGLALVTDDPDQTKRIVSTILAQAVELGRSSAWVIREIQFEAQSWTAGNRADWLRRSLAESPLDDGALDTHNERLNRFAAA